MIFCATIFNFQSEAANHLSESEKKQNQAELRYYSFRKQSNGYERRQKRFEFRSCLNKKLQEQVVVPFKNKIAARS